MKQKFTKLLAVAALLLPLGAWADGITDKASTIANGGVYYLYNVGAQKFVNINGQYACGFPCETPVPFSLELGTYNYIKREGVGQMTASANGTYLKGSNDNKFYFDGTTSNRWHFTLSETSSGSKIYTISYNSSGTTKYIGYDDSNFKEISDGTTDNAKWVFITPADFITCYNGDATLLVNNAGCTAKDGWTNGNTKDSEGDYWKGTSTTVFQPQKGTTVSQTINKLPAGDYTVQVVVRGTNGEKCTLQLNTDDTKEVSLKGNANGTVANDGLVSSELSSNKGWFLLQSSAAVVADGSLEIKVGNNGSSGSSWWQMCDVKLLKDADTEGKYQTGAATYTDLTSAPHYFYTLNNNALVKASANTNSLPNVIVNGTCATLKLTDGAYNFGVDEDFTATALSYDRSFTADQLSTVCLPFALTADEVSAAGTFYELASYSDGSLHFNEVNTTEAYKPYLFKAASTGTPFSSLSSKAISASTSEELTSTATGASMVGTLIAQTLKSDESNTLYGYKSDGTFVQIGSNNGAHINPFRAYIMIPVASNVKSLKASLDISTSIEPTPHLTTDSSQIEAAAVYNLSGKRVQNPVRGIYIRGNKKFMVK